jgi:hypothetical protein
MSDGPTPGNSRTPPDTGGPEPRPAAAPAEQVEKAPDEKRGRWGAWKTRANRILPPRPPEPEDRLTSPLPGIVLFLFLLGVAALSIFLMRPPAPLPASAPADQYSAARALTFIQALAKQPHPIGTAAHAEAQAYLIAQLQQLGLEPQVQKAVAVHSQTAARVENVLARLPGSRGGGKAVLLMAHYDSMTAGPGAGDDASGVATLLETARALKAGGRPLANDVIFMFSDGEEQGSLGAAAFVDEHPWAKDVGVVLNFDGAGQTAPNMVSDISPDNAWLISQLAQAAPDPLASSLFPDVKRLLGETADNDFSTILKGAGYPGFVIGSAGSTAYYHTALDDPAHVHLDSLQHQGSYALSLVRRFGEIDLTAAHRGTAVYFNVLGDHLLVHYPQSWVFPLVALAALVWIGALVFGLRWTQVSWRRVLLGALASLSVVAVLAGVGYLGWRLVVAVYPQYRMAGGFNVNTYNGLYYWLAFLALGVALAALLHIGLRTRLRTAELALGGLLLWLALALASSAWLPGASWSFTWPLLFGSIGLWGWFALRRRGAATRWRVVWLALFAIPAIAVVASSLYLGYDGLHIQLVWVAMAVLALLAGLLAPHLAIVARPRKWWLPVLMGIVAVGFLVAGHLTAAYTPARPLQDGVVYALSADNGKASWLGWSGLDVWTEQFFGKDAVGGEYRDIFPGDYSVADYKTPAPLADLPAPTVEERDPPASGVFHLRVVPPPGAWTVHLIALPYKTRVTYFAADRPIEAKDGWLVYWDPPAEGFDVTVKAPALDSLRLRVVAHTLGLPAIPGFTYAARPGWISPILESGDNSTWVAKTFSFE